MTLKLKLTKIQQDIKIQDSYSKRILAKKLKISLNSRPSELSCETYYKMTEHYEKLKNN